MKPDLENMSRKGLLKLKDDVDKALSTLAERERKAAIAAAEKAAAEHGFSLSELTGGAPKTSRRGKVKNPPKYRNPENPEQTWSGRGRKPRWIVDAEAAGQDLSQFAI